MCTRQIFVSGKIVQRKNIKHVPYFKQVSRLFGWNFHGPWDVAPLLSFTWLNSQLKNMHGACKLERGSYIQCLAGNVTNVLSMKPNIYSFFFAWQVISCCNWDNMRTNGTWGKESKHSQVLFITFSVTATRLASQVKSSQAPWSLFEVCNWLHVRKKIKSLASYCWHIRVEGWCIIYILKGWNNANNFLFGLIATIIHVRIGSL